MYQYLFRTVNLCSLSVLLQSGERDVTSITLETGFSISLNILHSKKKVWGVMLYIYHTEKFYQIVRTLTAGSTPEFVCHITNLEITGMNH